MADAYEIRPLEWIPVVGGFRADTLLGTLWVDNDASWEAWGDFNKTTKKGQLDSIDAAKAAAEDHYRERLMPALRPVSIPESKQGVSGIVGKWPGSETDEEIAQALEELS